MAILVSVTLRQCSAIRPCAKSHRTGIIGPEKVPWHRILGLPRVHTPQKAKTAWGKTGSSAQVRAAGRSLVMSKILSRTLVGTGSNRSGSME